MKNEKKGLEMGTLPKSRTIKKRNNIIRLELEKINKSLSLESLKIFNFIYLAFQFHRDNVKDFDYTLSIKQTTLKNEINLTDSNYSLILNKGINELLDTKIVIKNFTNLYGEVVREHKTHLITSMTDYIDKTDKKTKCFHISIDRTMFNEMIKKGAGYTDLNLEILNNFTSSYQVRIYEFCKSYQGMTKTPNLSIKDLNDLLFTELKFLGKIEEILKRSIKTINLKSDILITYEKDKKNKTIQFFIKGGKTPSEKSKENFAKSQTKEEDKIINKILNS